MWLTEWPQQHVITLQPQAKATWGTFYARATAVSLQWEMENMLPRQAGTLPFPFPSIPLTNIEWHIPAEQPTTQKGDTQWAHFLSCCSSYHRDTIFTRFPPQPTFLFPLIGKSKQALSWQICPSKANVAIEQHGLSENGKRVSAKELKQLPQQVRTNPILQAATQSSRTVKIQGYRAIIAILPLLWQSGFCCNSWKYKVSFLK